MWLDVHIHPNARNYKVYLDGNLVKHAFAANDEEGWVDTYEEDENGNLILSKDKTHLFIKRLHGKVELRKKG
jgi:hypothetical protein